MTRKKKATKFTDRFLKSLKPQERAFEVRDTETRGLVFRVQPTGLGTFYLQYRAADGKTARLKIGRYSEMGLPMARSKAKEKLAAVTLGGDPVAEKREEREERRNFTLRQFIDNEYEPWAMANLKSHFSVLKRLRYGFTPLLDKRLVDLSPFDFESNRVRRLKGTDERKPKPATVNRDQMTLRAALTKAVQWGFMDTNPLDKVKRATEDRNTAIRAITTEEETAILAALAALRAKRPPDWYFDTLFQVSLDTGLRRGEALALRWADIDFEKQTLNVRGSGAKSSQSRVVPLTARAVEVLTDWRDRCPDREQVFPRATEDSVRWLWKDLCTDAGVQGLRWHDLRHSYASRLAHAGAGVVMIKELLGHSSIATSQRYLHAVESDLRRAVDLLEAHSAANAKNVVSFPKAGEGGD